MSDSVDSNRDREAIRRNSSTARLSNEVTRIRAIAVDADPSDLDLLCRLLAEVPALRIDLRRVQDAPGALAILRRQQVDVVLADLRLGSVHGVQLLEAAREQGFQGAFIALTDGEGASAQAMLAGASDHVQKQGLDVAKIQRVLLSALDRTRLEMALSAHRRNLALAHRDLELRNMEIHKFSGILSHELRSPLTAVRLFVSSLSEGRAGALTIAQLEYLELIRRNCDQMRRRMDAMLDVTRLEVDRLSLSPAHHDLGELIEHAVEKYVDLARETRIHLRLRVIPGLPAAWVDAHRIAQVLENLLDNAIKFTAGGGSVAIDVDTDPGNPARLRVSVADTGKGIASDQLASVFERLYKFRDGTRENKAGLGLGLFICREIVRRHGGEISVESELGKGTSFTFTCPTCHTDQFNDQKGS